MKAFLAIMLIAATALSGCASDNTEPATCAAGEACDATTDSGANNGNGTAAPPTGTNGTTPAANAAPTGQLLASFLEGSVGNPVEFTINVTDENGDALNWTLDVDTDGVMEANGTANGTFSHTYEAEGTFTATLNVTDGEFYNISTVQMIISPPNPTGPCGAEPEPCKTGEDDYAEFWSDGVCRAKGAIALGSYYWHDRGDIPGTGFILGAGTWVYEEGNSMTGMQLNGPFEGGTYGACTGGDIGVF